MEVRIMSTIRKLKENNFDVLYFTNSSMAKEVIIESINDNDSVGIGGSMTIEKMGIYEELLNRNINVFWHWKVSDKDMIAVREKASKADIYITGTNAITSDGCLVNMDGVGNRVANMIYGHKKVYIVSGTNKICKDYIEASNRIKNIAAPKNAKRLNLDTPCAKIGRCTDCKTTSRICNVETILHRNPSNTDITIFLIDDDLGY